MKNIVPFLSLLVSLSLGAQQTGLPEIIPPSPTVANLMAFEEVPVDTYTGQPNIAIPLYSKAIGRNMSINASLRYHTSGIKIDNISGWTGTGWSLDIGGVISRTVRGTPDEEIGNVPRLGVLHNDDFWNYDNLSSGDKGRFNWNVAKGNGGVTYDSQPDLYQFSLFGASGRFVIVKENGVPVPKLLSRNQRVTIELTDMNPDYSINSFTIIDTFGYRYTFDVIESEVSTVFTGSLPQGTSGSINIGGSASTNVISNRSAWHLSKVATSNNETLVSITYNLTSHTYFTAISRTTNEIISQHSTINDIVANAYNQGIMRPRASVTYYQSQMNSQKPFLISFRDSTSMEFVTGGVHPENNGEILREIRLKNADGSENKRFTLSYETTLYNNENNRLWLTSVTESGGGLSLETQLAYNDKENLLPFDSEHDIWGYTKGTDPMPTSGACLQTLDFDPQNIIKGLLASINYPTGGSKNFVFENNTFSYVGDRAITSSDYMTDPGNRTTQTQTQIFDLASPQLGVPSLNITIDAEQQIFMNSNLNGNNHIGADKFKIVLAHVGTGQQFSIDLEDTCIPFTVPAGTYTFGIALIDPFAQSYDVQGNASLFYTMANGQMNEFIHGGGVRIKEISFNDPDIDDANPERRFLYDYSDPSNTNRSTGVVDSKLGNLAKDYTVLDRRHLFTTSENVAGAFSQPVNITYRTRTQGNNTQMTRGGYVGYRSVRVYQNGNGHTRFHYTSPYDFPSPASNFTYPFTPTSNIEFKRGLLLSQQVYHENGDILKETINALADYEFFAAEIAPSFNVPDIGNCQWSQFYNNYDSYSNNAIDPNTIPSCGGLPCIQPLNCGTVPFPSYSNDLTDGWARLLRSVSKDYFYDGAGNSSVVEKSQSFEYNEENFRQSAVNTFIVENGQTEQYRTETLYPIGHNDSLSAYFSTAVVDRLIDLNMVDVPIYTKSLKDNVVLNETFSTYMESHTDRMDLERVTSKKGGHFMDDRVVYRQYDTYGNPLEVVLDDGPPTSYLWGHNGSYPLAKVDNATYAQVLATGVDITVLADPLSSSSAKKTELDKLRTGLPMALVSTFTYDPLVGVIATTDPKNYTMSYEYDGLNRLEYVRDGEGKLISENKYNYKNQN